MAGMAYMTSLHQRPYSAPIMGTPHYPLQQSTISTFENKGEDASTLTGLMLDPSLGNISGAHAQAELFNRQRGSGQPRFSVMDPAHMGSTQDRLRVVKQEQVQGRNSPSIVIQSDSEAQYISSDQTKGAGP